jgi:hypothetical protein
MSADIEIRLLGTGDENVEGLPVDRVTRTWYADN